MISRATMRQTGGTRFGSSVKMSALGQKQTYAVQYGMSALPPLATAKADIEPSHSITSLALARSDGGTERPNALAVLRLMISSYFFGAWTGRSAGFSPLRMRST